MAGLDALLKFRCRQSLVDRLVRIASHPKIRRDLPDLLRIAVEDYVAAQEKELHINPSEDGYLVAAEAPAPYGKRSSSKPKKKVA